MTARRSSPTASSLPSPSIASRRSSRAVHDWHGCGRFALSPDQRVDLTTRVFDSSSKARWLLSVNSANSASIQNTSSSQGRLRTMAWPALIRVPDSLHDAQAAQVFAERLAVQRLGHHRIARDRAAPPPIR